MTDVEQIKATIDLRDLISESCKLDSSGRGAHANKHDSKSGTCLYVTGDFWYCHHCHAGGDVLSWIMDRDNVDFPDALQTAAEIAGIPLDGVDPAAESDRRAVFDVLKTAAVHFHENLTDAHRADISDRWGITDETIDKLLIGIARNDEALEVYLKQQGFTHDQIIKSGLFFDWSGTLKPHFKGRYVFPYWKSGTVKYMIARQTKHTPKGKYEQMKYKKLLTHNDKRPYVSEHVRNDTLYGVDSLRGVSDWCLITEGVTDCIMTLQAGIPCISPVTTKFRKADHKRILKLVKRLKTVYICNDNEDNEAGLDGAIGTAEYLEANGISTKLITLPRSEGVEKIDLAEYLRDHGVDEFKALFDTAVSVWKVKLSRQHVGGDAVENVKTAKKFITDELSGMDAPERAAFIESDVKAHFELSDEVIGELVKIKPTKTDTEGSQQGDMSSTDRLIELGKQDTVFFNTPDDSCYAAVKLETGGSAIYSLNEKSRPFKRTLKHRYYNATGKAPAGEPLKAAIGVLESIAAFEGETIELHNRVAWHNGNICYDLTNANFEAIEITSQGWSVMPHGHIIFRRFGHQIPQVQPIPGGDVWQLYEFIRVPEPDQLLDMVYLISCLVPDIPHVIPILTGEHGSAKTTGGKMSKAIIDPSALDVMSLPSNAEQMIQVLYHHWFTIFDNVAYIKQWQSDMFCRASTGEGQTKRTLYTDDDDTIYNYKRCIGLNGINNAASKPDLLDRAIFLNREPIPKDQRVEEKVLFERFNAAKPEILGGMFDVLSNALRIYPTIDLAEKPRMADFVVWGCAIAKALGRTQEEFLDAYYANIRRINQTALAESMIGNVMLAFMEDKPEWNGTPTQLHNELEMLAPAHGIDVKSKFWVKRPESLGKKIRVIMPNLRAEGIVVEIKRAASGQVYHLTNHILNCRVKPTQPTQPTRHSGFDENRTYTNLHQPTLQPTQTGGDAGCEPTQNDEPTQNLHTQNRQQAGACVGCVGCVGFVTSHNIGVCGKCGCVLSGQTFQGPAGLGLICAECQAELDRASGQGERTDEQMLNLINAAIYRLGFSKGIHEFDIVRLLGELPKGTGATTELLTELLDSHLKELKIIKKDDKLYKKEE